MTEKPRYKISRDDIPLREIMPMAGAPDSNAKGIMLRTKKVHGTDTSIMFADRDAGYHTVPHVHDCEQFNIVVAGEIWFYVEDQGYCCRAGDVMRIPRNKVHWAWNRSDEKATVIESHSPPLTGDAHVRAKLVSLLGPDDDADAIRHTANKMAPYDPGEVAEVEERSFREEYPG